MCIKEIEAVTTIPQRKTLDADGFLGEFFPKIKGEITMIFHKL